MVYCGNNANSPRLQQEALGTRYQCLRKGVGAGKAMPVDPDYATEYNPIVDREIYCGKAARLPRGYQLMGSASECLQKGIGIGKRMKYLEGQNINPISPSLSFNNNDVYIALFAIIFVLALLIYYYKKPTYVTYYDKRMKWGRVITFSCIISFIVTGVMWALNNFLL